MGLAQTRWDSPPDLLLGCSRGGDNIVADEKDKATENGKAGGKIAKVAAVVFGALVAPVIVAVVAKWADPALWKNTAPAPPPTTAAASNSSSPSEKQTKPSESTPVKQQPASVATYKLKEIRKFTEKGHTNNVLAVAISPDGKRILSGGYDRTLRLWDVNGGPPLKVLQEPAQETIWHIHFLPDGRRALTGGGDVWKNNAEVEGSDFQVRLWDLDTGKVIRRFKGHTKKVYDLALTADGRTMLTGSMDTTVRLWDVETAHEIMKFQQPQKRRVWSTALTADGRLGLSGDGDGEAHLWDIAKRTGMALPSNRTHVLAVAFSPDGKRALTGAVGFIMRLWEVDPIKQVAQFQHSTGISSVTFSPNG